MTAPEGFAMIPRSLLMDPGVPPDAKLVYAALSAHAGAGREAWPKQATMAAYLGISERQVRRSLTWLRESGYISWETQIVGGMRSVNVYTLPISSSPVITDRTDSPVSNPDRPHSPVGPATQSGRTGHTVRSGTRVIKNEKNSYVGAARRLEVERLCKLLADRIEGNGCKRPAVTQRWRDAVRLMIDRDGRTEEQITRAINWCQDSDFWRANILSMPKLREKYETLRLQALREQQGDPEPVRQPVDHEAFVTARMAELGLSSREEYDDWARTHAARAQ